MNNDDELTVEEERARLACEISVADLIKKIQMPLSFTKNDYQVTVDVCSIDTISDKDFDWAVNLVKRNLKDQYVEAKDMGWSTPDKREEMSSDAPRFLIARVNQRSIGYVHFQFSTEELGDVDQDAKLRYDLANWDKNGRMGAKPSICEEVAVVYCYELQLEAEAQGRGLGHHLMELMEQVGRVTGMYKSMLTVFKSNTRAIEFYSKRGYSIDPISPPKSMRASYDIMSKLLVTNL
ncbi:hypothetical protein SmJEL517_g04271 [Synchytrium microbalum]|uniref:N-alpha-acetyltransferase 40 n=1 Tax=Synchytrium microbalum TaxID=1806994 RepID=A0A507BUK3_9FUNG|nr:uncharacterized protein SmJEL517_g04271 [Synchytrium microbalum]TPX32627.1 hypothetical protein SmJEL517_g04271 [Synchytrium microbalum]